MEQKSSRASKTKKMLTPEQRVAVRDQLIKQLLFNEVTLGQALKQLRLTLLAVKQQYADFVNVSRKTLSDLENDKGNYSIEIINQVLRPFELQVGIVPIKRDLITQAVRSSE
ncbi:transcriptional regulator [Pasteurellaceae bacterium Orientalotternb1]|nr:transcriptional regulator [Pasteurellaceae bacterium Orientalotternb1]